MTVHGYKVFNPDWTCSPNGNTFQYAVGGIYKEDVKPMVRAYGFHFCKNAADCFSYYPFNPENKVAEVLALGEVDTNGIKSCTNKIQILREIPWQELLELVNTGKGCTGRGNSGDKNSGNYNSGNENSGSYNSGYYNSGDYNSGNYNSGDDNSGYSNSGHDNSGNRNSGDYNSGSRNSGDYNSGHDNSGNYNSGHYNSGDVNSGNYNSGDYNSGNRNSGNRNSGDWNKCSFSNGCFNTVSPKIYLFNKPSEWTYQDWLNSEARHLLNQIPGNVLKYVYFSNMTDEEKIAHPEAEVTDGYLKELDNSESAVIWWHGLCSHDKAVITAIPNFDKEIFREITGINVDESTHADELTLDAITPQNEYEVTEVCPHCESEVTIIWNVKTMGYKAFCPVCGECLMLCNECLHAEDGRGFCDYDRETDSCYRNSEYKAPANEKAYDNTEKSCWQLKCVKDLTVSYFTFKAGKTYNVKDKFVGKDGTVNNGDWEVKTGMGGLLYVTKEQRDKYFVEV